jgi:glycosyltransferase involved in cell wall biosynthesis
MNTLSQNKVAAADKPIRVCFVILRAYPLFNPDIKTVFGGAEVDLYLLATELASDPRFNVQFVVGDYGQPAIEQRQNVTLIKSLDVLGNYFLNVGKVWKALACADADIYIQEACSLLTTTVALFCKRHHRRFIYRTAHTDETDGTYFRRHPFRGRLVRWAFRAADTLIVQNQEDQSRLLRSGLKSIIIRNVCRLRDIAFSGREYIFWAGRSGPIKRPDLFIRLAKLLPDKSFVMICSRTEGDNSYDDMARAAATVPNLRFIAGAPFEQMDDYFEKAMVYVNTSESEGFPNTFVQACKSATPILSLNVNPDGFLDRHQCGLCAGGDWEQFIQLTLRMLTPETARQFGRNGRLYAENYHDIKQIIELYKNIFIRQ